MPTTFFGLPAHPLLVHVPVVLIPLAALGGLAIAVRPSWRARFGPVVVAVAGIGTIGAFLAASAGESLADDLRIRSSVLEDHMEWGDRARFVALAFFVVVLALVAYDRWAQPTGGRRSVGAAARREPRFADDARRAPRWVAGLLAVATVAVGVAATSVVLRAGHLGAKVVWSDVVPTSAHSAPSSTDNRGTGGS